MVENGSCGRKPEEPERATRRVEINRVSAPGTAGVREDDLVAAEEAVTIMVADAGSYTIMCTPTDLEALAAGFAFSEGIVDRREDIYSLEVRPGKPAVVAVEVAFPQQVAEKRNLIVASSCGLCGVKNLEKVLAETNPVERTYGVSINDLFGATEELASRQVLFDATGGSHAAAIFDRGGRVVAFAEDIGRHNALDKAVGMRLLSGGRMESLGAVLSGRISLELVVKAVRAGVEVIAGVSAPSSLAIDAAERWNITLCGFVRGGRGAGGRANIYTHPDRIAEPA